MGRYNVNQKNRRLVKHVAALPPVRPSVGTLESAISKLEVAIREKSGTVLSAAEVRALARAWNVLAVKV